MACVFFFNFEEKNEKKYHRIFFEALCKTGVKEIERKVAEKMKKVQKQIQVWVEI